jgi:hypothetical protein
MWHTERADAEDSNYFADKWKELVTLDNSVRTEIDKLFECLPSRADDKQERHSGE